MTAKPNVHIGDVERAFVENPSTRQELARLVGQLKDLYDELYPVGGHQDDQWGSASDYLEALASILVDFFGPRPTNSKGIYVEQEPKKFTFAVIIETDSREHAEQVMAERMEYEEDYDFEYTITHESPDA